ncbi:hypothetical protein [Mycolicibacterium tokaiense]|uniref:PASTA domain-containing protein n=1 Tax=Mycolicibacterium tokaiense TaxID=39695 RepID=A0A378THY0_9MYCO|nr:hypothetical protein [Mycolicibacterium tokaiense]BBY85083.1 hypothetical protein MTOK_08650 [Mycolicibacterium tokaiense]STZ60408.1 Uncharacterised protein [Mycolicibacterium tokaiense]
MTKFGFATTIATAATAALIGLAAPAMAAPTGAGNAQDTISSLQDQGYKVIVNRLSTAPLAEASVVSVGEGPTFSHTNSNNRAEGGYAPNSDNQFAPVNTKTVYVNVR